MKTDARRLFLRLLPLVAAVVSVNVALFFMFDLSREKWIARTGVIANIAFIVIFTNILINRLASMNVIFSRLPRAWDLFQFALPKTVRDEVYEPALQELLKDYLLTRQKYRTKRARDWLTFCFTFRTALLVLDCIQAVLKDRIGQWLPWIAALSRFFG